MSAGTGLISHTSRCPCPSCISHIRPPSIPPPPPLRSLPPPPPIILELFCCVPLIAQHTLSAVHDVWLVCRWVGPAPTLQRGVGRGVRATSTPQLGCPSAPATPWTLQKAERASLQVSSTFCIVIGLIYCVTTIPHCTKAGVQRCDRSDLVCLTVCLQQAVHAMMERLPDACIIATAVKPCQLNGNSMDCSGSINVSKALYI